MKTRNFSRAWLLALPLCFAIALACTTTEPAAPPERTAEAKAEAARLWTKEFQAKSILIANEISIEGPPGLIEHVAIKQQPEQTYAVKTIAEGFLQEISAPAEAANPIEIQIDNLAIYAVRNARILERVSAGPVRIRARGEVMWKNLDSGQEQRVETLELNGPPAK